MHSYSNIHTAWEHLLCAAQTATPVVCSKGEVREMLGCHVILDGGVDQFLINERRRLSPIYASAELLWYLRGSRDGKVIKAYAPQYQKFLDDDGTAYGAYGHRMYWDSGYNMLEYAIQELINHRTTKKCVISLWKPDDLREARKHPDIPCTLTLHFMIRDNKLVLIVYMRSNDLWLGFPYDVYCFTAIQRYVAGRCGIEAGQYHHIAGSMHLYSKHLNAAREAIRSGHRHWVDDYRPFYCSWDDEELEHALDVETTMRMYRLRPPVGTYNAIVSPILLDSLECCSHQFGVQLSGSYFSPVLQKGMELWTERNSSRT